MTRATMPGKNYTEYTPEQLQLICDKLSALEDKAESQHNSTENCKYVIELWNSICKSYSKVTSMSPSRKTAVNARLVKYTTEHFEKAFKICENSDFLKGNNDRNWHATFDWIINENNLTKVLDGNYGGIESDKRNSSYDSNKYDFMAINLRNS